MHSAGRDGLFLRRFSVLIMEIIASVQAELRRGTGQMAMLSHLKGPVLGCSKLDQILFTQDRRKSDVSF